MGVVRAGLIAAIMAVGFGLLLASRGILSFELGLKGRPLLVNVSAGSRALYDAKGGLLRLSLSSDEKFRLWTPLKDISPQVVQATLLYEDKRFFSHGGIDLIALFRAMLSTYVIGGPRMGGSTLSMQLARMRFAITSSTPLGKLEQMLRALQLEQLYSKEELLEAYLNLAPYGENIEGVGAASRIYFGKAAKELTLQEALSLAVVPQNPSKRRPSSNAPPMQLARARLAKLWQQSFPRDEAVLRELSLPLVVSKRNELPFRAPHFSEQVLSASEHPHVVTTLDGELQEITERVLRSFVKRRKDEGLQNAALMLIDWHTMAVRAQVGSASFFDASIEGQVDGTRARRSPGSALKPFIYGLAMDEGLIHPRTMLKDTPASFASYDPENFDKEFLGPITATYALVRSRNLPAVQLANQLQGEGFYGFLKKAGIGGLRDKNFYGLSLTLGGVEVTLQELVSLYAMLANGGELRSLRYLEHAPIPEARSRMLSPEASFLTLQMLSRNPRPSEASVEDEERAFPIAWKTGTSYGFRDAWALGVFGEYVLGIWVGNFDGRGNPAIVGREAAGELFFAVVDAIRVQRGVKAPTGLPKQRNLKREKVCSVSGQLPGPFCRHQIDTWFIPGKSPISTCSIHREIVVETATGLRACVESEGTHREVAEFWSSDLLALFRQAGLPRRTPPAFRPECKGDESQGIPPEIVSPQRGVTYQVRLAHLSGGTDVGVGRGLVSADEPVPLRAVSDADAKSLYWFADTTLIGRSLSGEPLFWSPSPGTYVVRVVDEQGRSDAREVRVEMVQ